MCWCVCHGIQRQLLEIVFCFFFFHSTLCVLEIELGSTSLQEEPFTHWAISPAHKTYFFERTETICGWLLGSSSCVSFLATKMSLIWGRELTSDPEAGRLNSSPTLPFVSRESQSKFLILLPQPVPLYSGWPSPLPKLARGHEKGRPGTEVVWNSVLTEKWRPFKAPPSLHKLSNGLLGTLHRNLPPSLSLNYTSHPPTPPQPSHLPISPPPPPPWPPLALAQLSPFPWGLSLAQHQGTPRGEAQVYQCPALAGGGNAFLILSPTLPLPGSWSDKEQVTL